MKRAMICLLLCLLVLTCRTGIAAAGGQPMPTQPPVPVWVNSQPAPDYQRETPIDMPAGDEYLYVDIGVTTWRKDSFRANAATGLLDAAPVSLNIAWDAVLAPGDTVSSGFSFYSQPAIVHWPKEVRLSMNLTEEATNSTALKEVIFASLDGHIYFLNLADGTATRQAIDVGYPLQGCVTVHPLSYPLLMAGQHSSSLPHGRGSIGLHYYELLTQHSVRFIDGRMPAMTSRELEGAFSASALIDRSTNTAVALSQDGYLYTEHLELRLWIDENLEIAQFDTPFSQPVIARVTDGSGWVSAPVMCGSRLWFGTSEGEIICVDTTTMQPLWTAEHSGMLLTLAMEQDTDGQLWLYTGTSTSAFSRMNECTLLRVNADTGETDWTVAVPLAGGMGGAFASPVIGEKALDGLVFCTVANMGEVSGSTVLALDRRTGEIRWQQELPRFSAVSPVAVYDEEGSGWLIAADDGDEPLGADGTSAQLHLLNGLTGEILYSLALEGSSPSSPAFYGNMLVIGTTTPDGGHIYGVRISGAAEQATPECWTVPHERLSAFLQAWSENNHAAMLELCAPAWKTAQANAERSLFSLLANRTALEWRIAEQPMEDDVRVYAVEMLLDRNNGSDPQWYRVVFRLPLEDGVHYVDPNSLATYEQVDQPGLPQ